MLDVNLVAYVHTTTHQQPHCVHVYVGGGDVCSYIGDDEEVEETQEE